MSEKRTGLEEARQTQRIIRGPTLPTSEERQTPLRPSEKRRRRRVIAVTFSSTEMPDRLRALAQRWGMFGPDGRRPNVSALIEHLLEPQVDAAEAGEIDPPERAK